jgi:hypothetical protein
LPAFPSRRRLGALAAVHLALFGLQAWELRSRCGDCLGAGTLLATHPVGTAMLACVLALQVRRALRTLRLRGVSFLLLGVRSVARAQLVPEQGCALPTWYAFEVGSGQFGAWHVCVL